MSISYTGSTLSIAPSPDVPLFLLTQKLKHLAKNLKVELFGQRAPLAFWSVANAFQNSGSESI